MGSRRKRTRTQYRDPTIKTLSSSSSLKVARALNLVFPGTGPGGYFGKGNRVINMKEDAMGNLLIRKIARTFVRGWLEEEIGYEFGIDRRESKPSLQIELKPNRPFPNISLKWNMSTLGTTNRLEIENATVRYLNERFPDWGNNRSPTNNYVAGSTVALAFKAPSKTVYFDHLSGSRNAPIAHEAFTGRSPGKGDVEAWIFLAREGVVRPGTIFNFQNEVGQSVSKAISARLVDAGYRISVVPFVWWSRHLSRRTSRASQKSFNPNILSAE